jgi:predicted glycosyltransferase
MTVRVLFYVQHLLGVGHLRRSEIIADAMAAAGLDVTVTLGGKPVREVPFRGVRIAQLPPAQIAGEDFSALRDAHGKPVDEAWRAARRDALLGLFGEIAPDVLLIELYPFGRRQFAFELRPLLGTARTRTPRPRIVCSVRDILVASKKPGRAEAIVETIRTAFDAVLVHGDPALIPFEATFPLATRIADLIRYTGYVAPPAPHDISTEGAGEILVSAGGGAVGTALLDTALAARPLTALRDRTWRLIAGPNFPAADFDRLSAQADATIIVERFREDFVPRLATAALSISQAGYNTTMDILRTGVRAVVVPYETPSETEQRLRSDILAANGLLTIVPANALTPHRLASAIAEALAKPPAAHRVNLSGAEHTARLVAELAERGSSAALRLS